MKFIHIADMHFDAPFSSLSVRDNLASTRRMDQRNVFRKVIDYALENRIDYLFISGDLYEQSYVKKSTIDFIKEQFDRIPKTNIFISPGNHDPYLRNSYYANYDFGSNVYIFKGDFECKELADCNIYGMGFTDFYAKDINYSSINILNNDKPNIMIMHAYLNGTTEEEKNYNPILESRLESFGFDYVALGHIHKRYHNEKKNQKIVYPGSLISLGFDELGEHGMIVGSVENKKLSTEFVKLDDTEFTLYDVNVDKISSKEELIEKINEIKLEDNKLYEIVLTGRHQFEIKTNEVFKMVSDNRILKIKDTSKIFYDIDEIQKEKSLKGLFVKNVLKQKDTGKYTDEEIEKALEIGLNSF